MRYVLMLLAALLGGAGHAATIAASPDAVQPILLGSHLPDAAVRTIDGQPTSLSKAVGGKPAVLVFYRGGWCPYCNLQLSGLRLIEKDVQALGFQIIAISPDRPEELRKTLGKDQLNYTLLSDSSASAIEAFGLAYTVNASIQAKYREAGVDLEQYSGETHHILPVASVYIVDADGLLQFSYVHPDYRVRLPSEIVLAATRAIAAQRHKLHPSSP
ncbi:MAG: peroxiredoxin-like family protein [Dokdonella sp.]